MQNYTEITQCRTCGCEELVEVLDLNNQPLANNYHEGEKQEEYPLKINVCSSCFHVQLSVVVNPDLMFKDYLYVSGTSETLHKYFEDFARLCEYFSRGLSRVLDIACNDGTQLDKFKEMGWKTTGVDPATNLYHLSCGNHYIVCDYWNEDVAAKMYDTYGTIVAQNVFAHTHDLRTFLNACAVVADEKTNIFIQTSQADMIVNNEFDTIYHEHLSFFNTKSMKSCANLHGFSLVHIFKPEIHGGSYLFVLRKGEHDEYRAEREIKKEEDAGLYNLKTYTQYAKNCRKIAKDFNKQIQKFRKDGYKIVGYGAAAKGNTFLNFAEVDLDYIVDDNELKWNLMTPGRDITIRDPQCLANENTDKLVVVPLAWNFFDEISAKCKKITGTDLSFIRYFPEVRVV